MLALTLWRVVGWGRGVILSVDSLGRRDDVVEVLFLEGGMVAFWVVCEGLLFSKAGISSRAIAVW